MSSQDEEEVLATSLVGPQSSMDDELKILANLFEEIHVSGVFEPLNTGDDNECVQDKDDAISVKSKCSNIAISVKSEGLELDEHSSISMDTISNGNIENSENNVGQQLSIQAELYTSINNANYSLDKDIQTDYGNEIDCSNHLSDSNEEDKIVNEIEASDIWSTVDQVPHTQNCENISTKVLVKIREVRRKLENLIDSSWQDAEQDGEICNCLVSV